MIQIRIFTDWHDLSLQNTVNAFLEDKKEDDVLNVAYIKGGKDDDQDTIYKVIITYRTEKVG